MISRFGRLKLLSNKSRSMKRNELIINELKQKRRKPYSYKKQRELRDYIRMGLLSGFGRAKSLGNKSTEVKNKDIDYQSFK